ncbi:MAG: hypothetical protein SCK28_01595 [Bacillota bacterium]|nr:hypothetical protein [Bacillota bacterium]
MSKLIEGKYLGRFSLLPAAPGTCLECAEKHEPDMPHNQQSLFYQYKFYNEHGRWPTWEDAIAHCDGQVKKAWLDALRELGVIA